MAGYIESFLGVEDKEELRPDIPAGGSIESFVETPEETEVGSGISIDRALEGDPEAISKARKAAREVGLPEEAATVGDPRVLEQKARRLQVDRDLADAPVTAQTLSDPNKAAVLIDDVSSLSMLERVSRGFRRGITTREMGQAGYEASLGDTKAVERAAELSEKLRNLGHDDEGFVSYLAATAEILGQQWSSFTDPDAAVRIGGGGTIGATAGLAGGPLAPVTSAAGAVTGLTAGAVAHFTVDAYQTEAGHAYLEQIELGIDPTIAKFSAHTVGLLNAGLEMAGAKLLLAPLGAAKRAIFREGVREFAKTQAFKDIAVRAAKTWATGVAGEVSTEVTQEAVAIVAAEVSKAFDKKDFETITAEEVTTRLAEIAEKTFKGTVLLAGGGASVQLVSEVAEARKAKANAEVLQQVRDAYVASPAAKRDPEVVAAHVAAATKANAGMDSVYIPAEALVDFATATDEGRQIIADLGIESDLVSAYETGGDVKLSVEDFTRVIMPSEAFDAIRDDVRVGPEEMTAREAEQVEAGLDPEADLVGRPTNDPVMLAEQEMGLKALFNDATDVGMTKPAYESYLVAVQEASDVGRRRQELKVLKEEERKLTKEYAKEREYAETSAREELSQQPVFEVLNSIGVERLDRAAVEAALPNGADQLSELPKSNGRAIVTQRGEAGIDPDALAELHGFADGQHLLFSIIDAGDFESAVQKRADQIVREKNPDFTVREKAISEARDSLLNSTQARVLEIELNALREAEGQKRVSAKALRSAVQTQIRGMTLEKLEPTSLLNSAKRAGREAGILLRKGDRQGAAKAKLRQLKAFEAAKEAYRLRAEVTKKRKFLRQFSNPRRKFPSLPVRYLEEIRETLDGVALGSRMTEKRENSLRAWAKQKYADGVTVDVEGIIDAQKRLKNYQDMPLAEFNSLYNAVRALQKQGQEENKLRRENEQRTVDQVVTEAVTSMFSNIDPRVSPPFRTTWQDAKRFSRNSALLTANPDTIVRELDGFKDLGPVHQAVKAPYDRAYRNGYNDGQIGYAARQEKEAEALTGLLSVFDAKERANMRRPVRIPGVDKQMSHGTVLSVLLNSGNADNKAVLLNEFTEAELSAVYKYATKRDWDFAQSVWDYLESLWPEVEQTTIRRKNFRPERVAAEPIQTAYGEYAGGYFPIRYDSSKSVTKDEDIETMTQRVRFGEFVASHTKDNHTKARQGSGGRKLLLDPFVLNSHVDQVIYDLEMGDAVNDIYKVLNHPDMKKAFADLGRVESYEALEMWMQDIISGEMHLGGAAEHFFRYIRSGFTISKLGLNMGTVMLQPLGLLQSATLVGKKNMTWATMKFMTLGGPEMGRFASEHSGLMRTREETFNKEIMLASQQLSQGIFRDAVVGRLPNVLGLPKGAEKAAQIINASFFYGIKKAQRMVDVITFWAAHRDGMRKFNGDFEKAVEYAEMMVVRTQASGIFGDRSALERGTTSAKTRQTELIRIFTPLMSYFIAKNNIAYERTKQTNFKSPAQLAIWATDMMLLYTVEAALVAWLRGQAPDPDDEEDGIASFLAAETVKSVMAGVPLLREFASEAQGFRGGGTFTSILGDFGKTYTQFSQGEVDEALVKSASRFGGAMLRLPASQPINTSIAVKRQLEGEDMELIEFLLGPRYEGPR